MRTSAIVLAALFASVESFKLNQRFASGMGGTEELGEEVAINKNKYHFA